jgi:hypothetical protein
VGRRCIAVPGGGGGTTRAGGWAAPACDARALFSLSPVPLLAPPVSVSVSGTRTGALPLRTRATYPEVRANGASARLQSVGRWEGAWPNFFLVL